VVSGAAARAVAFRRDESVEPAHLTLDLLEPVPLQLEGVLVEPLAGAGGGLPDRLQPLGEPGVVHELGGENEIRHRDQDIARVPLEITEAPRAGEHRQDKQDKHAFHASSSAAGPTR
jgi:hypothetical protein